MTKRELIDEILRRNPSAAPAFLARFDEKDLTEYLEHLNWVAAGPAQPIAHAAGQAEPASAAVPSQATGTTYVAAIQQNQTDADEAEPVAVGAAPASEQDTAAGAGVPDEPAYDDNVNPVDDAGQAVGVASETSLPFAQEEAAESQSWMF